MQYAAEKIEASGNKSVILCERGSCFGYRDLVVDFRNLQIMHELGYPVIFDATHSVMKMGAAGGKSSGNREYVGLLASAAVTAPISGLFLEVHDNPDQAPSDGANMLNISSFKELLKKICQIRACL